MTSPAVRPVTTAVILVLVELTKVATTVPPTTVIKGAAGAFGASASITIAALVAKFPAVPAVTAGKVRVALFPAESLIVAPAEESEVAAA